jgi:peptidoglycan/xylan/chitin deacetylase (PgdA/CDA1 family)
MQPETPHRGTSLALLALTLITGMALGWLLRDVVAGPALAPGRAAPTSGLAPTGDRRDEGAALATASAPAPTAVPMIAPEATRSSTGMPAPTSTEEPTSRPAPTATFAPAGTAAPSAPTPTAMSELAGYLGHVVSEGETLARIAEAGGSTAAEITRYNRLSGEPPPGRPLIVPRLAGRASTLPDAVLLVRRGMASRPWVALTLDAGAGAAPTGRMLQALRERKIRITFFLTGRWIRENPDLTRQIVADGHEIANHTFSHPDLTRLGTAAVQQELAEAEAALHAVAPGASMRPLFRPPYGAYDERVLRTATAAGYLPVYWTLDSLDSVGEPKTPEFLLERVTAKLPPAQLRGAIILAHCGSEPTAAALPAILDRFAAMGLEVRTVSEVLNG